MAAARDDLVKGRKSRNPKNLAITRRERTTLKYLLESVITIDRNLSWIYVHSIKKILTKLCTHLLLTAGICEKRKVAPV